jgi:hypothetical protein
MWVAVFNIWLWSWSYIWISWATPCQLYGGPGC